MKEMKYLNKNSFSLAVLAVIFFIFAVLFPLSGDDWQWGADSLVMPNLNGRYLGHVFVMYLTHFTWLRPFIFSLVLTASVYLIAEISVLVLGKEQTEKSYIIPALLLMLIPLDMMRQVYVWTAGFSNYTVPVPVLLFVVYRFIKTPEKPAAAYIAATCAAAFAAQFFAEHITIANTVLSWLLFTGYLLTAKKIQRFLGALTASFTIGAVVMFGSSAAYTPGGTGSSHAMPNISEMLGNFIDNFFDVIAPNLINNNIFLNLFITVLAVVTINLSLKEAPANNKIKRIFGEALSAYMILFNGYMLLRLFHPNLPFVAVKFGDGALSILFYLSVFFSVFFLRTGPLSALGFGKHVNTAAFFIIYAGMVCAPLSVVTPIGERCFFIAYAFLAAAANILLLSRDFNRLCGKTAVLALMGVFILYFSIYGQIYSAGNRRIDYIHLQLEQSPEEIIMPRLPFDRYVWVGTPADPYNAYHYKRFYNIPENVQFNVISYEEWIGN